MNAYAEDRSDECNAGSRRRPVPGLPQAWSALGSTNDLGRPVVHVVDDDENLRKALAGALASYYCDVQVHEHAEAFLDRFEPRAPQGLVLDLGLPGMNGIQLLATLKQRNTVLPTIVLSSNDDVESVVRAIQGGALDFLPKPPQSEQLAKAIEQLLQRAPQFAVEHRIATQFDACVARLTPRELQVYDLLAAGATPKQVAVDLGLRPRTAHIHCSNVLTKFHLDTPGDLLLLRARLAGGPMGDVRGS
ncbi:MAG: response regulator transcription factor [Planctomycetota bacterium]